MKSNFPHFPYSSTTTEKNWDKELLSKRSMHSVYHPLAIEIEFYYPYFALLDRESEQIMFLNRHRTPIPKSCRGDKVEYWYKIDITSIIHATEYEHYDGIKCEVIQFYEQSKAYSDGQCFSDFMQRLSQIERHLSEVSPFQQRFALTIKKAYLLKEQHDLLKKENERLLNSNKVLLKKLKARGSE